MTPIDPNQEADETLERARRGLEQLARELDARSYPGQAWDASRARGASVFDLRLFRSPLLVLRERVRVRAFRAVPEEGPHPSPLPEYQEREKEAKRPHPGRARRPSQWGWKIAGSIAGIAAVIALALHGWKAFHPPITPSRIVRVTPHAALPNAVPGESELPRIVIVEDLDSYSIIDLNNDFPLVSFASKDSLSLDDTIPVLLDSSVDPGS